MIWILLIFIATLGGAYAIFGGLKAIAVSDTFNGVGTVVGGLMIAYFSLKLVAGSDAGWGAFKKLLNLIPMHFSRWGQAMSRLTGRPYFQGSIVNSSIGLPISKSSREPSVQNLAEGQRACL